MIEAVIFDMDGVIFDSERAITDCWKVIADKYELKDIETLCISCLGLTYEATKNKFIEFYGSEVPYEAYKKECSDLFHKLYDGGRLPIKKGVRELLDYLKESGIKTGLASSTRTEVIKTELTEAGLIGYFEIIAGGDMVARGKPAPDVYLKAMGELGLTKKGHCFAIEDSFNGIRSAHSAGLEVIMVPDILAPTEEIEQLTVKVLNDLNEVKDYMRQAA